jgi:hypothetical protein
LVGSDIAFRLVYADQFFIFFTLSIGLRDRCKNELHGNHINLLSRPQQEVSSCVDLLEIANFKASALASLSPQLFEVGNRWRLKRHPQR